MQIEVRAQSHAKQKKKNPWHEQQKKRITKTIRKTMNKLRNKKKINP